MNTVEERLATAVSDLRAAVKTMPGLQPKRRTRAGRTATLVGSAFAVVVVLLSVALGVGALRSNDAPLSGSESVVSCPITVPPRTFMPPDGYPAQPTSGPETVWFGTAQLWTVLNADGSYTPTKGVWWSADYPGGTVEPRPDLSVTWHRLDVDQPDLVAGRATNAFTAEDGWFIIAGVDLPNEGCWEVSATYRGTTLTYVHELVSG